MKSTAKKLMQSFDADNINFVITPFSLLCHWTGAVAARHKENSIFYKGSMWIIIHMDSMNKNYNDYDDGPMNIFVELLHHFFKPSI